MSVRTMTTMEEMRELCADRMRDTDLWDASRTALDRIGYMRFRLDGPIRDASDRKAAARALGRACDGLTDWAFMLGACRENGWESHSFDLEDAVSDAVRITVDCAHACADRTRPADRKRAQLRKTADELSPGGTTWEMIAAALRAEAVAEEAA